MGLIPNWENWYLVDINESVSISTLCLIQGGSIEKLNQSNQDLDKFK